MGKVRQGAPFEALYIPEPNSGCWLWGASLDKLGYGKLTHHRRTYFAHRYSWIIHRGEIPLGMHVLHRCDTRACVNPEHLFLGTPADNAHDRDRKGRNTGKLTKPEVQAIRADFRVHREIAKDYGVSRIAIVNIKTGRSYAHVS
jgi:hypothetical protein